LAKFFESGQSSSQSFATSSRPNIHVIVFAGISPLLLRIRRFSGKPGTSWLKSATRCGFEDREMTMELSNSLSDLAARIRAAHQAVGDAMKHAIAAGELLIEAKEQVAHGEWLPWLEKHCELSGRTAQAYMRLARELGKMDPAKAQRVADLSVREAVKQIAHDVRKVVQRPEMTDRVLEIMEQGKAANFQRGLSLAIHEDLDRWICK
jgi:hypothetical protein